MLFELSLKCISLISDIVKHLEQVLESLNFIIPLTNHELLVVNGLALVCYRLFCLLQLLVECVLFTDEFLTFVVLPLHLCLMII